jgi:hypothetical protein
LIVAISIFLLPIIASNAFGGGKRLGWAQIAEEKPYHWRGPRGHIELLCG